MDVSKNSIFVQGVNTMKKNKLLLFLIAVLVVFSICVVVRFTLNNYFDAKKLVKCIKNENLYDTKKIIDKNPECLNTYPSIMTKGWQSAMNLKICYPLTEACDTGNIKLISFLIEKGANPNCNDGLTPLSITYSNKVDNWYKISLILIENGASLNYTTDYSGEESSVLQDIVQKRPGAYATDYVPDKSEEVMKAFNYALEYCDHSNVNWMRVLQHSVTNDRVEIVKLLLDEGYCDVNDTSVGMTALMFAARDSAPEMVQLLLDYGADKRIKSSDGKTAYDYAVEFNNTDIIAILEN